MTEKESDAKVREVAAQVKARLGELDDIVAQLRAILTSDSTTIPGSRPGDNAQEATIP